MQIRKIICNNKASAIPLILFFMTIVVCGALYHLLFIQFAQPSLEHLIPSSDAKTYIMMLVYAIPLIIIIVGGISVFQAGLKKRFYYDGGEF